MAKRKLGGSKKPPITTTKEVYLTGGYIGNNYMDNPSEVLMENHRNRAQAEYEAHNSLLPQILDTVAPIAGAMASNFSAGQQAKFANWVSNTGEKMAKSLAQGYQHQPLPGIEMPEIPSIPSFATGGFTGSRDVEVEGQEMFELPNGITGKFEGPSHENGGIDVTLPTGTEVYSKRIKGPDSKSMAKRKEERDKILAKIEKDYKKNPLDKLLGQSYNRTKQALEIADQLDLATMEQARQEEAGREQMAQQHMASLDEPMFATGGYIGEDPDEESLGEAFVTGGNKLQQPGIWGGPIPVEMPDIPGIPASTIQPPIENTKTPLKFPEIGKLPLPNLTSGDILGIAGNVVKANRAHKDTLAEIATSLPNVNSFDGFGQDALQTLQGNAGLLQQMYDLSTQQLRGRTNANMAQSRGSARGVNQMRAMDLANIQAENQAQAQLDTTHAGQVIANNNAIAQQQNLIDQAEMRGDAAKRLADQQDHGQDHMNLQQTRQAMVDATLGQAGEVLNKSRERDLMSKLISARFDNFETDAFGNITSIPDQAPMSLEQELEARGLTKEYNTRVAKGEDVELRNGKLYKKGTNEVVAEGNKTELEQRIDERNYAGHYERGLGLEGISDGVRYSPGEIKAPSKFYSGVKMKDVEGYLQAHSSEFGNLDLSTEQGVAQLQQQIGAPVDGKFGKDTKKALEDRYKDAKTSGGYQAGLSKKEYQDLGNFLADSKPVIDSIFDKARSIYGDFSPEDFHRDPELMEEATRSIILGGITHADELYDKYKDSMGDLTKEELRKISLLSPEAIIEKDGKLTVDLDRRAPGSNYTLGYKVRGTKHKKRFAKKD